MLDIAAFLPPGWTDNPQDPLEVVTVEVDGRRYLSFIRAQVRAGFREAARAFELKVAAEPDGAITAAIFHAGAAVQVYAGDDLLIDGFVDQYMPHLSAHDADIVVRGRSKSADLIDGDPDHPTGYFENKTPLEIGNELAKGYGAQFETDQQLQKLPQYTLTPGGSIFREVEKMTRKQGFTITGTPKGNAKITKPSGQRHAGGLIERQTILVGNADHNWSNRHSKYMIRGQRAIGHGSRTLQMVAQTKDSAVTRKRVKSVVHDDDGTRTDLKKRIETRAARAAGNALKASISTVGMRDEGGTIWTPGFLVWTESQFLNIAQDMLIEAVDMAQGPEGTISLLSLVDPRAYAGAGAGGGKGNKSGSEWNADMEAADDLTPVDL